jgi:predicted ribosomally synthesized peptide with nif11-like leader
LDCHSKEVIGIPSLEEQIAALINELKGNKVLQEKLLSAPGPKAVKEMLHEAGYSISDVEIEQIESALVEAELEAVAGGVCWSWTSSVDCTPEMNGALADSV